MTDGEILKQKLEEIGMPKTVFADRYGCSSQNVYILFHSKEFSRPVRRRIEKVLKFKFKPEPINEYKIKYYKLLEKYTKLLEKCK